MAVIGQQLKNPEAGWIRIDDPDPLIDYSESNLSIWKGGDSYAHNYYKGSVAHNWKTASGLIKFNFMGSKLRIILSNDSYSAPTLTNDSAIFVDGEEFVLIRSKGAMTLCFDKTFPENTIHKVVIEIKDKAFGFDAIDLNEGGFLVPELSRDYEFPVKIGNEADVAEFSASLIAGEEQLLITREGKLYLTNGNGGYKVVSEDIDLTNYYTKSETDASLLLKANQDTTYTKTEVDTLIAAVEPPAGATHTHDNKPVIDNLNDSAGMLSYKGKVVVNNSEYSFKTLPRKKAPVAKEINSTKGGRLPWQV